MFKCFKGARLLLIPLVLPIFGCIPISDDEYEYSWFSKSLEMSKEFSIYEGEYMLSSDSEGETSVVSLWIEKNHWPKYLHSKKCIGGSDYRIVVNTSLDCDNYYFQIKGAGFRLIKIVGEGMNIERGIEGIPEKLELVYYRGSSSEDISKSEIWVLEQPRGSNVEDKES